MRTVLRDVSTVPGLPEADPEFLGPIHSFSTVWNIFGPNFIFSRAVKVAGGHLGSSQFLLGGFLCWSFSTDVTCEKKHLDGTPPRSVNESFIL